uniref:Uncharacterized protein n=1 Tax=Rhizophora mucronata TaxID=61149 RepID=A0A2P2LG80_RHIMU
MTSTFANNSCPATPPPRPRSTAISSPPPPPSAPFSLPSASPLPLLLTSPRRLALFLTPKLWILRKLRRSCLLFPSWCL